MRAPTPAAATRKELDARGERTSPGCRYRPPGGPARGDVSVALEQPYRLVAIPGVGPRKIVINAWALATGHDVTWIESGDAPAGIDPDGGVAGAPRRDRTDDLRIKSP